MAILPIICVASGKSLSEFDKVFDRLDEDCPAARVAFEPLINAAHRMKRPSQKAFDDAVFRSVTSLKTCASGGEACCQRHLAAGLETGGLGLTQDKPLALQLYVTASKAGDLESNFKAASLAKEIGVDLSFYDYSGVRLIAKRKPMRAAIESGANGIHVVESEVAFDELGQVCPQAYSAIKPYVDLSKSRKPPPAKELDDVFWKGAREVKMCASQGESCCQAFLAVLVESGFGFTQDKKLSLQLYLAAATGGDMDAKIRAETLSSELGIALNWEDYGVEDRSTRTQIEAVDQDVIASDTKIESANGPPNASPVSAFVDLTEFLTPRSLEIARQVLYGSEMDALQEARVCALDGDPFCTYLCGLLNEYGAPGIAISQATAISRYEQAALNGVEPAARAVSRLNGSSVAAVELSAPVLPRSDSVASTTGSPTAHASNVPMPREVSSPNTAVVAAPIRDQHPANGVIPRSSSIEPQSYSIRKIYRSGVEVLIVEGPISIEMNPAGKDGKSYLYDFRVFNFTGRSLDVSPAMFVASQGGERVLVHSYAEMEKKLKSKHRWQKVGAALAVGLDAYSTGQRAGRGYASGSFSGRSYNHSQGSTRFSGTFQVTYDDPLARELAFQAQRQRTQNLVGSLNSKQGFELSELADTYLRRQTVQPQEGYAGSISVARAADRSKRSQPVTIKFSLNGQSFQFDLPVPQ
ncbi:MAG: hypothetical protein R3F22_09400 [Lysobacteraceae bacterium]